MDNKTYVLTEFEDLALIGFPLKTTNRIKYTCFSVSNNILVFGATSGGLYVFKRDPCKFLQLVPNKEGPITQVAISPDEKLFGFATSKGTSCVLEMQGTVVSRRILSPEHTGTNVTALHWNALSSQMYIGDDVGRISVINVSSFMSSAMFQNPSFTLMHLDSKIVQFDWCSNLLLVSTLTRCYLCDTIQEQYRQIGSRLRDGQFGACFYNMNSDLSVNFPEHGWGNIEYKHSNRFSSLNEGERLLADENLRGVKVFCARPGSRLWEVRIDGTVISTHQFKDLLAIPPTDIIQPNSASIVGSTNGCADGNWPKQSFNFNRLLRLSDRFLFTFNNNGIYILNPLSGEVVLWSNYLTGIVDAKTVSDVMYLWLGESQVRAISLKSLDRLLIQLYLQKEYNFCAEICSLYADSLMQMTSPKLHLLRDLLEKVEDQGKLLNDAVFESVSKVLEKISDISKQENHMMLESGMLMVGNTFLFSEGNKIYNDNFKRANNSVQVDKNGSNFQEHSHPESNLFSDLSNENYNSQDNCSDEQLYYNGGYDPFPDLPLSALTSPEAVTALKEFGCSVSNTISMGTKSLKEKWHFLENKFRHHESLSGDFMTATKENNLEKSSSSVELFREELFKLCEKPAPITSEVIGICNQITEISVCNDVRLKDLQLKLFNSLVNLYELLRSKDLENSEFNHVENGTVATDNIARVITGWINDEISAPFPISRYFSTEIVDQLRVYFHSILKNGTLVNWLLQCLPLFCIKEKRSLPVYLQNLFNSDDVVIDFVLSRLLQIFSSLFDPCKILQCLISSQAPCQYLSWCVIIDHFQTSSSHCEFPDEWPLPRKLIAMMLMLRLSQVESCRSMGSDVSLKHVLYLIFKLDVSSESKFHLFLSYVSKLPEEMLLMEMKSIEVQYFITKAFNSTAIDDGRNVACECGFPLKFEPSHLPFLNVGRIFLSSLLNSDDEKSAMKLCNHMPNLWPHFLSLKRSQNVNDLLPLLLHVGSTEELERRLEEFSFPVTWKEFLQLRLTLYQGHCLNCHRILSPESVPSSFSWTQISLFLLRCSTAEVTLQMLNELPIPEQVDMSFYQTCLLSEMLEKKKKGLRTCLLKHLCNPNSSTKAAYSPQIAETLRKQGFGATALGVSGVVDHHWGVYLQLKKICRCCHLPLVVESPKLMQEGLTTFKCGHVFHAICILNQTHSICPVCASMNC